MSWVSSVHYELPLLSPHLSQDKPPALQGTSVDECSCHRHRSVNVSGNLVHKALVAEKFCLMTPYLPSAMSEGLLPGHIEHSQNSSGHLHQPESDHAGCHKALLPPRDSKMSAGCMLSSGTAWTTCSRTVSENAAVTGCIHCSHSQHHSGPWTKSRELQVPVAVTQP